MKPEIIMNAIEHTDGPIPIDFGSGPTTGIHCSVIEELRDFFGLEKRPIKIVESYQMLGEVDDELKEIFGIRTEGVSGRSGMFGFPNDNWKEWRTPWGQEVLVPGAFNTTESDKGDIYIYPEGDMGVPASGHMPGTSFFFDTVIRQDHFDEENLNPDDNIEEFGLWSGEDFDHLKKEADRVRNMDRFVMANLGGSALGDIAVVPGPFMKDPRGIRDVTEWYMSTVLRQDYIKEVFDRQTDYAVENLKKAYEITGDAFDAIYLCGTDFGTQNSTFCSPDTFIELWLPYYRRMTDWIHENTHWMVFKHSCGAVETFYPHFIEAGFDLINPVQVSAAGMDAEPLKEKYGRNVVFWGGGVDTQQTLPFGSPAEVHSEVMERCRIFSSNGGFVFNSIHNIQAKTPVHNFVAMINAVREFNSEPKLSGA